MTPQQKKQLEKLKDDIKKMNDAAKKLKAAASLILLSFCTQAQDTISVMSHGELNVQLVLSLDKKEAEVFGLNPERVFTAVSMLPEYFEPRIHVNTVVYLKKDTSLEVLVKWLKGYFNFDFLKALRTPVKNTNG